ncbi:NnrS family protein [Leptospira bandrabouensis]|uniref:NnrS family protein n=1 Tax=Leptospira bandrabouensis TaxID=2484903 RepID=A0A6H3NZ38_9LEPT|nr:NnrS family protein [Leptospira bandrabouensis]MCW7456816.1 NnrS family protein [Leptospira bandrabouensis]MCW7475762.1 NnrS family protein [Leptospira bandrabouensis]MCW7483444.1 NnrS family protein [Leptospira bandrabouensis]TGN05650.1 NnrS family protein [Leptospira bandrabouensis]TGN15981.1 NnrS family protein [Leptospira bandrabouensis]
MKTSFFQWSLWNTAFRPFFWFGSLYGISVIGIWLLILSNAITNPIQINSIHWHSYEMVFGFSKAIVLGFLFTAVQNWTNSSILKGKNLFFLLLFWTLGRFSMFPLGIVSYLSFGLDISSDLMVILLLYPKLIVPTQKHNRPILYHYGLFTVYHLLAGLSARSVIDSEMTLLYIHLSIFVILFLILIIGGRVVPFFTGVVIQGYSFKRMPKLETVILYLPFVFYVSKLIQGYLVNSESINLNFANFNLSSLILLMTFLVSFTLFVTNLIRYVSWKPWRSYKKPILWILYTGYFWVCLGFLLYSLVYLGFFPVSSAIHSLTVGGIGVFIYGMITRVSLGHTGRSIVASPLTVGAYIILNFAVIVRVFFPLFGKYTWAYHLSGICWILAFSLFIIQYTKILFSPRPDGKPA